MDDEEHSCVCKCTDAFVSLPIFLLKKSEPFLVEERCLELIASLQWSELLFFSKKSVRIMWIPELTCQKNIKQTHGLPAEFVGAKYVLDRVNPSKVFNFIRDFLLGHSLLSLDLRSIKSDLTNHYYRLEVIFKIKLTQC